MAGPIRRLAVIALIAALLPAHPAGARPPRVLATIAPVHSLAAMVMGGTSRLDLLVKGKAGPHGHALRPSDARLIRSARVIFWIGPELETFLTNALATLARHAHVVSLSAANGVFRRQLRSHAGAFQGNKVFVDPHIWLDPVNAAAMVRAIQKTLSAVDPANARTYAANARKAASNLATLDRDIRGLLAPVRRVPYVVFHDAFGYFEARYGLNSIAAITSGPERAPGARRLRAIHRAMTARGVRCMFGQPGARPALAETLGRGTGARYGVLDALGAGNTPGPGAYGTLLRNLAKSLTECLAR